MRRRGQTDRVPLVPTPFHPFWGEKVEEGGAEVQQPPGHTSQIHCASLNSGRWRGGADPLQHLTINDDRVRGFFLFIAWPASFLSHSSIMIKPPPPIRFFSLPVGSAMSS